MKKCSVLGVRCWVARGSGSLLIPWGAEGGELDGDDAGEDEQHGEDGLLVAELVVIAGVLDDGLEDGDAHQEQQDADDQADEGAHGWLYPVVAELRAKYPEGPRTRTREAL